MRATTWSAIRAASVILLVGVSLVGLATTGWAAPRGFDVEEMVSGLENPVTFAFAPDGRIFVGERTTGQVRVIENGQLLPRPFVTVDASTSGERGLLGLALSPNFEADPHVYLLHSRTVHQQRITRFTDAGNTGVEETVIFDDIPAAVMHNGGSLAFGPDGMLYFTVGDRGRPETARDLTDMGGKLHRITPSGEIPADNPFPGSTAFGIGLRNSFGFTFRPLVGGEPLVVYLTENGPTTNDEINRVLAGSDLGWPQVLGHGGDPRFVDPLYRWSPTTAPVGIVYYWGENFPVECHGDLFFAEYETGRVMRLLLNEEGTIASALEVFLEGEFGHLFALELAPDGTLWFSTTRSLYRIRSLDPPQTFIRGNVDGTSGVTFDDGLRLLGYLLKGGAPDCAAAADVNADERIDLSDVSTFFGAIYGVVPGTPGIPFPYPRCGLDRKTGLRCESHPDCP